MSLLLALSGGGGATAGTPLSLRLGAAALAASALFYPADNIRGTNHALTLQPFRQYAAAAATGNSPSASGGVTLVSAEQTYQRSDHNLIHRYRTGYQTVGQPLLAFTRPRAPSVEAESFSVNSPTVIRSSAPPSGGQPWFLLYQPVSRPIEQPTAYSLAIAGAVSQQVTVAATTQQPWLAYTKPATPTWAWDIPLPQPKVGEWPSWAAGAAIPPSVAPFSVEVIDLNDEPWLYPTYRRTDHDRALQPFRQYVSTSVSTQPWLAYTVPPPARWLWNDPFFASVAYAQAAQQAQATVVPDTHPTRGGGGREKKRRKRAETVKPVAIPLTVIADAQLYATEPLRTAQQPLPKLHPVPVVAPIPPAVPRSLAVELPPDASAADIEAAEALMILLMMD
jgi:hypothetical protein